MEQLITASLQLVLTAEVEEGPGIAVVEGSEIGFVKEQDIAPPSFKGTLLELIREDRRQHVFVVHKDNLNLHVSKIKRPLLGLT
tara:strand:+ start:3781 stop:4032 length:252 start_codon:yes stop_codon:yes gene_type:complete